MSEPRKRGRSRLTLLDLAAHAGVSRATASLVLGRSPLVAEKTRARVLESARLLGYVYNRGAANLRTRHTHTIGISVNEITNPYFTEITAAIQRAFFDSGRTTFVSNSEEETARQDQFIDTMREYNVDGLVICPATGTKPENLARLKEAGIPCVLVSRNVPGSGLDYAGHANARGMREATEHLIGLGHRRIAMVGGNTLTSTGRERRQGYLTALKAHGIGVDPALMIQGVPSRLLGATAIKSLLDIAKPPTAAVCFNDVIAFGVMLGLRQIGREPGRDFAVTGYDDLAEAALWTPALTTVRTSSVDMGTSAARLLLERIEHPDAPPKRIETAAILVVRESSCPPAPRGRA